MHENMSPNLGWGDVLERAWHVLAHVLAPPPCGRPEHDNGAPITLLSATLGHADLKTTSVYANARPGESSGRYLKTK